MRLLCLLLIFSIKIFAQEAHCPLRDPSENVAQQVGLDDQFRELITGKECDAEAYTQTPCKCYEKESAFTKFTYGYDLEKDERIQKRIARMKEEKRKQIYEKWMATLNDTFQNMLYFDQLVKYKLISKNLLARVPNCSFGGMFEKVTSAMKGVCSESEFVTKLNVLDSKFNSSGKKYSNFQEYLKSKETNYKDLVDNQLHRENSCVPYQTFASASMMHSLSNEDIMGWQDHSFLHGSVRGLNMIAVDRYNEITNYIDEESFKASVREHHPDWTPQQVNEEFRLYKNKKVLEYTLSKMNSKNPFLKLVSGNVDLYERVRAAMTEEATLNSPSRSTTDILLSNETALAEIFDYQDEICSQAFGGKMLVQTACGDIPITPQELASDEKILKILHNEESRRLPKTLLVRNYCEKKKGRGKRWQRVEQPDDPLDNLIHNIDPLSETEDLLTKDTSREKSSYENFDEMYCKIFSRCDGRTGSQFIRCNDPDFYFEELTSWAKENAGITGEIDWTKLFSSETNDYIDIINGLAKKNFTPEEQASFILISKMIITQSAAINFGEEKKNAPTKRFSPFVKMPDAYMQIASTTTQMIANSGDVDRDYNFDSQTNMYQMATNFGSVDLDEDVSALFANYFVRSSSDDYQNVALASQNYDPSNDDSFNIYDSYNRKNDFDSNSTGTGYAASFVQNETTKIVNSLDNSTQPLMTMSFDQTSVDYVSATDTQRSVAMTTKTPSASMDADIFDSVTEGSDSVEILTHAVASTTNTTNREDSTNRQTQYDELVEEVSLPTTVGSMPFAESVNYAQSDEFIKNSQKLQSIRDKIASRQKEIERLTSEITNSSNTNSSEPTNHLNNRRIANSNPQMSYPERSMAAHPNWGDHTSSHNVSNGANTNFNSVASAPTSSTKKSSAASGASTAKGEVVKGGPKSSKAGRSIASVAHANGSPSSLELSSLLEKNGIQINSKAAEAISSIEKKLKNKKLSPIMFDEKGNRRKFISLDFAYPMGLKRLAVSTGEVGKEEIGFIRYIQDPYQPFIVFILLKHQDNQDKLHNDPAYHLPLDQRVMYYENNASFEKIDDMIDDYKLSRVVRIPFDAKKHDIKEIGYTYSEIFSKTVGDYDL